MKTQLEQQFESLRQQGATSPAAELTSESVLSFVVPVEVVDLPSQGKFYPDGHPLKDKSSVEIKQMTAKEEDILTNKSFIKKGVLIDKLIESLLVDKSIEVSSLLVGDKNAIMVAARAAAYGDSYDVFITCPQCNARQNHLVSLGSLQVFNFDKALAEIKTDETIKLENTNLGTVILKLPKTGWFVELRPLNGSDERRMFNMIEARKSKSGNDELSISEQLSFIIKSINAIDDKNVVIEALSLMPASDAKFLRNIYQKLIPNVKIMTSFSCDACNSQQELEVPFTQEFFWPK